MTQSNLNSSFERNTQPISDEALLQRFAFHVCFDRNTYAEEIFSNAKSIMERWSEGQQHHPALRSVAERLKALPEYKYWDHAAVNEAVGTLLEPLYRSVSRALMQNHFECR